MTHHLPKLALVACLALSACAERSSLTKPEGNAIMQPGMGLVVASLGQVIRPEKEYWTKYPYIALSIREEGKVLDVQNRVLDTQGSKSLGMAKTIGGWNEPENLIITARSKRMLVVYALKPGNYTVIRQTASVASELPVTFEDAPLKFQVKAGEITYLGSYELRYETFNNLLGTLRPVRESIAIKVRDHVLDDLGFLTALRPEVQSTPVTNALATKAKP